MTQLLVNIDVRDLEEGIAFYTAAFGLRVGRRFGLDGVELLGAGVPVHLLLAQGGTSPVPGASLARDYGRHWTPVHLDFVVDDLEAAVRRAELTGAKSESTITDHAWGRMALLSDPFGHGLCLLQFTGRGYDEIATGSGGDEGGLGVTGPTPPEGQSAT
jgi:predicted enzyme related to lactoylglutathione lyase